MALHILGTIAFLGHADGLHSHAQATFLNMCISEIQPISAREPSAGPHAYKHTVDTSIHTVYTRSDMQQQRTRRSDHSRLLVGWLVGGCSFTLLRFRCCCTCAGRHALVDMLCTRAGLNGSDLAQRPAVPAACTCLRLRLMHTTERRMRAPYASVPCYVILTCSGPCCNQLPLSEYRCWRPGKYVALACMPNGMCA